MGTLEPPEYEGKEKVAQEAHQHQTNLDAGALFVLKSKGTTTIC